MTTQPSRSVAFVVSSRHGHVRELAEAAAGGVTESNLRPLLIDVTAREGLAEQLAAASAVVFCTPTYLGGPTSEFVEFAEWSSGLRESRLLDSKLAGGITCGFAPEGGKVGTLHYLLGLALQHSMIWVGLDRPATPLHYQGQQTVVNAEGYRLGVGATLTAQGLSVGGRATGYLLGRRMAQLVVRGVEDVGGHGTTRAGS